MKKLFFIIMLSSYTLTSFAGETIPSSVIWGKYCGECVGECSTFRQIDESNLLIDKTNRFFKSGPFKYEFNGVPESKKEYEKYKWLLQESIPSILNKRQTIFGNPDGYDQCGYLIIYSLDTIKYKVLIDPDRIPEDLQALIDRLFHGKPRRSGRIK